MVVPEMAVTVVLAGMPAPETNIPTWMFVAEPTVTVVLAVAAALKMVLAPGGITVMPFTNPVTFGKVIVLVLAMPAAEGVRAKSAVSFHE